MLVTLLPGDTAVVEPAALTDPAVLRSANQLPHPVQASVSGRGF